MIFSPEKILVFDVSAGYGQFKKYFTNMSPLTFSIPPRTVLAGLLGAIIGIDKLKNPEEFSEENSFISLKVLSPIRKVKLPTNYLKTSQEKHFYRYEQHKPTNVEYLKDPSFRVYVSHRDKKIYEGLMKNLSEHKTHYTLCLGISSCLANFNFIGEFSLKSEEGGNAEISSIVPKSSVSNILFNSDTMIQQCTLPVFMKNDREVTEYKDYFFEVNGGFISADFKEYFKIRETGENIVGM